MPRLGKACDAMEEMKRHCTHTIETSGLNINFADFVLSNIFAFCMISSCLTSPIYVVELDKVLSAEVRRKEKRHGLTD